jgi:hypothetical protein
VNGQCVERVALISGQGKVAAVAQAKGVTRHDDRIALEGDPLTAGHPVYDAYIGRPDPAAQPVAELGHLREPARGGRVPRSRPCACGCGETSDRDFAPVHEFRAIPARIRDHFSGSTLALVQWIDKNHP